MDDFLIAFGTLCFVIYVYLSVVYHIKGIESDADAANTSLP